MHLDSDTDEIRYSLAKLTLDGFFARLYLPAGIPAAIILYGDFYIANGHYYRLEQLFRNLNGIKSSTFSQLVAGDPDIYPAILR